MNTTPGRRPLMLLTILSICLLFLGINGFIGGYLMLRDPNGAPMGIPVSDLERTPFKNFFIPGLLLIFIWGCGSMVTLTGLWRRQQWPRLNRLTARTHEHWSWVSSVMLGLGLLVWLTVQVFTLPALAPIQFILYGLAALLAGLPMLPKLRQHYRIP